MLSTFRARAVLGVHRPELLARHALADVPIDRALASDLPRAATTAQPPAGAGEGPDVAGVGAGQRRLERHRQALIDAPQRPRNRDGLPSLHGLVRGQEFRRPKRRRRTVSDLSAVATRPTVMNGTSAAAAVIGRDWPTGSTSPVPIPT